MLEYKTSKSLVSMGVVLGVELLDDLETPSLVNQIKCQLIFWV